MQRALWEFTTPCGASSKGVKASASHPFQGFLLLTRADKSVGETRGDGTRAKQVKEESKWGEEGERSGIGRIDYRMGGFCSSSGCQSLAPFPGGYHCMGPPAPANSLAQFWVYHPAL